MTTDSELPNDLLFDASRLDFQDVPPTPGTIKPDHSRATGNDGTEGTTDPVGDLPPQSPTGSGSRWGSKRRASPRAEKPKKPVPPKPRPGELVRPLTEMYISAGLILAPFDPVCSEAVVKNAEDCAKSLDNLARANPAVRRAIIALTQTSAWGGVLAAHLPLILIIIMHHGPKDAGNLVKPYAAMLNGVDIPEEDTDAA